MTRFSVLIPVYNVENYLDDCLNSVLNQTFTDFEVICVDDGSTDKSLEILENFKKNDKRIKIVKHEKNQGLLAARVSAVKKAKGDYFVFLDSDDSLKANALEIFDKEITKYPVEILMCNMNLKFTDSVGFLEKKSAKVHFSVKNKKRFLEQIFFDCFKKKKYAHNVIGKVIQNELCKKVYERVVGDNVVISEDLYAFFMLSYYANTFRAINKKLYNYNLGRGVTGNNYSYEFYKKSCAQGKLFKDLEKFLTEQKAKEEYFNVLTKIKERQSEALAYDYCFLVDEKDKEDALKLLSESFGEGEKDENKQYLNIKQIIEKNQKLGKEPDNFVGKFRRKVRKDGFFFTVFWALKMVFKI